MKTFFTLSLVVFSLFLRAQDLNTDYTPIEFTGKIPDEFLKDMREITEEELNNRQGEGLTKKQGMDYYASSNYILRDLYLSGYVYFNDTLTQYVNTTAKEILKHLDAKDAAGLRFYVTKFSIPNALSWRNGTVLINIGLFDYVENEAQLAFILSHEIEHYLKQHSLNMYVRQRKLEKRKGRKELQVTDVIKDKNIAKMVEELKYSRSQEFEADLGGFELFLKTDFDPAEAANALHNLVYIDSFPQQTRQLDIAYFFNNPYYTIDTSKLWQKGTVDTFDVYEVEETEDTLSTHPSLTARVNKIKEQIAKADTLHATVKNKQNAEGFQNLKKIVAFEKLNYYFITGNYEMALYRSLVLQKKYPDNIFLKEITANALFWLTYYNTYGYDDVKISAGKDVHSNYEYLIYYLDKISGKGLEKLTLGYIHNLQEKYPDNDEFLVLLGRTQKLVDKKTDAKKTFKSFSNKESPHYNFVNEMQNRK